MERSIKIDLALKAWLDNVLVPAMVRQYLAACNDVRDNGLGPIHCEESDTLILKQQVQ